MLSQQQMECIDHLSAGAMTILEVANKVGCTSRVIYKWKNNGEFRAELDKRSREFKSGIISEVDGLLVNKLGQAMKNVIDIANDKASSDKVRLDANQYIINRILGNTTTKIEQSAADSTGKDNNVDITKMLAEIDSPEDNPIDLKMVK